MSSRVNLASKIILLIAFLGELAVAKYPLPCEDDIYCYGEILHTVQMVSPFPERKTFVDLPLKIPRETVKINFATMMTNTSENPSKEDILVFLGDNFGERGAELERWNATDWKPNPEFLSYVRDDLLRQFGSELNAFWKELGKRIKVDVKDNPDMYSLIYLPNPVILPGGRFLELYYWDTYWIIRGLLHCEMTQSAKGMLQDFLVLLNTLGYIPNGNRVYYTRTQPPFLIQMFTDYIEATADWEFLERSLPSLEKEFDFWMQNRSIDISISDPETNIAQQYTLYRYISEVTGPRPEGYSHDYLLAQTLETEEERDDFYINMKSGAESGWDFTSRWFPLNAPPNSSLLATKTSMVVPVDLNAIIYKNAKTLAAFHQVLNNSEAAEKYTVKAKEIETAINAVLWDNSSGVWYDYDLKEGTLRRAFYPSNIFPLWAGVPIPGNNQTSAAIRIIEYLLNAGALIWDGGIPTSLVNTTQQWDFPNAWPPLQHLFVESLDTLDYGPAQELAFDTAQKWVASNYLAYKKYNNTMYEKYRADIPGEPGGGGLYDVVVGFGWSNGVIIDFLEKYGDRLSALYNNINQFAM